MCGIHAIVSSGPPPALDASLKQCLCDRGPDHYDSVEVRVYSTAYLKCTSTVLSLRGDHVTRQPFVSPDGDILCWNGEAWRIDGREVQGNDGEAVFELLVKASAESTEAVFNVLRSIEGPFAYVYFERRNHRVFFGRDRLGRRSLLIQRDPTTSAIELSSVAPRCDPNWSELRADGIYIMVIRDMSPPASVASMSRWGWVAEDVDAFVSGPGSTP
jgi:asparagine synthetase B (glutamine-hydrolysing)